MTSTDSQRPASNPHRSWWMWLLLLPVLYVLSIGPVGGMAFWLEENTQWKTAPETLEVIYWPLSVEWPIGEEQKETILLDYVMWWTVNVYQVENPIFIPVNSK